MFNSLLLAIRFLILVFSSHKQVALENIALRQQLAVFTREKSDLDCAIETDYFGLLSRNSGRIGERPSCSFSLRR
jgi:hypothetical protein